jgi:hypothetical protein
MSQSLLEAAYNTCGVGSLLAVTRNMIARIVLWSLADSKTTVEELRRVLADELAADAERVPGLRLKLWLSDEPGERWGAVELWESAEAAASPSPVHARERELIGKDPEVGEEFELEQLVQGRLG